MRRRKAVTNKSIPRLRRARPIALVLVRNSDCPLQEFYSQPDVVLKRFERPDEIRTRHRGRAALSLMTCLTLVLLAGGGLDPTSRLGRTEAARRETFSLIYS